MGGDRRAASGLRGLPVPGRRTPVDVTGALLLDALWAGWFETAQRLGCVAVVTDHRLMDAAVIGTLHGAGLRAKGQQREPGAQRVEHLGARIQPGRSQVVPGAGFECMPAHRAAAGERRLVTYFLELSLTQPILRAG